MNHLDYIFLKREKSIEKFNIFISNSIFTDFEKLQKFKSRFCDIE